MFELRRALERMVVLKITPRLTADDIQELDSIIQQIEQNRDPIDFQKYDRAFHRYLASLSNNTYIINALNTVWDLSDWVGASILYDWSGFSQAAGEHLAVYEFMTAGEAEKAAAASAGKAYAISLSRRVWQPVTSQSEKSPASSGGSENPMRPVVAAKCVLIFSCRFCGRREKTNNTHTSLVGKKPHRRYGTKEERYLIGEAGKDIGNKNSSPYFKNLARKW